MEEKGSKDKINALTRRHPVCSGIWYCQGEKNAVERIWMRGL